MTKIKTEIIIICILWITTIISVILGDYINIPFKIGIVGLVLVTLSIRRFYIYSICLLMLLLLISIFNLITFCSITFYTSLFGIPINITSLFLSIILIFKRKRIINKWLDNDSNKKEDSIRKVDFFKNQFLNLSETQLINKLENEVLVPEATDAINTILKERKDLH